MRRGMTLVCLLFAFPSVDAPEGSLRLQFRTVNSLDGEQLDAVIVPVFKEGDAPAAAPSDTKELAEWVVRESGERKIFTATTHLQRDGAGHLVVVAAGDRNGYDIQRAWQVVS